MGNDRPFNMEGIGTVHIKMLNGTVWELKKVRYVSQLKSNLISVGALKALFLEVSIRGGVLKIVGPRLQSPDFRVLMITKHI